MYWIFLIIFIIMVLLPDIIRGPVLFLGEERAEEAAIFFMGTIGFLIILRNEILLALHIKEREKNRKKINQTVKDLVESYSYIGEVNRKMDILMSIALGISDRSLLNKKREKEIYDSIVEAANFLMKGESTTLRFINSVTGQTEKEIKTEGRQKVIKNKILLEMDKNNTIIDKDKDCLVVSSPQKVRDIKGYIIIAGYSEEEEQNPKNLEILKVFSSQAIFLYSYINIDHSK